MLAVPDKWSAEDAQLCMRISQADLSRLPPIAEWIDLARNASEPNPFFEHWFLRPALAHLVDEHVIRIAELWTDGQLCGLYPLSVRDKYGRSPVRNVGNWAHYQCFLGTPLIREGYELSFWRKLIEALDAADWSGQLMSFSGLDLDGPVYAALVSVAKEKGRPSPIVHHFQRAMLQSDLDPEAYLQDHVRGKKRKEWRRLNSRLSEMGDLRFSVLDDPADLPRWIDDFFVLEAAGWKGKRGAAMANTQATRNFFSGILEGADWENLLEMQRLDLDGRAIAMLVNLLTPPGSWSFKIAYDEELARFSPGVMIEIKNLERVLESATLDWMDSCAVENHPMIDGIWAERRPIVQVSVPLSGLKRRALYSACRVAETGAAGLRKALKR